MTIREMIEAHAREEAERVMHAVDEAAALDDPWYGYPAARDVVWMQYPGERRVFTRRG